MESRLSSTNKRVDEPRVTLHEHLSTTFEYREKFFHQELETFKSTQCERNEANAREVVLLRQMYDEKIKAVADALAAVVDSHFREHELREAAFSEFKAGLGLKLEDMNALRDQISVERATYITRSFLDAKVDVLEKAIDTNAMRLAALESSRSQLDGPQPLWNSRLSALEGAKSNYDGRLWMLGIIITGAMTLFNWVMQHIH